MSLYSLSLLDFHAIKFAFSILRGYFWKKCLHASSVVMPVIFVFNPSFHSKPNILGGALKGGCAYTPYTPPGYGPEVYRRELCIKEALHIQLIINTGAATQQRCQLVATLKALTNSKKPHSTHHHTKFEDEAWFFLQKAWFFFSPAFATPTYPQGVAIFRAHGHWLFELRHAKHLEYRHLALRKARVAG